MQIKNLKRKLKRKAKAISPILAVLMMIIVAVAAGLVAYAWVMGYLGFTTTKAGHALQIQSIANHENGADLVIYAQNVGEGTVELEPTGSSVVYVNGASKPCSMDPPGGLVAQGTTVTLVVAGEAGGLGEKVRVKVVTLDGTFTEITGYPGEAAAGSTTPVAYKKKSITVNSGQVSGTLPNFPMLVSITGDSDLQTDTHPQGWDIHFTDNSGGDLIYEIEQFDQASGTLVAWVKVPSLTDSTIIYLVYGDPDIGATLETNPAGVWSNGYAAVWHLEESGSGSAGEYMDSTINGNNGQGGAGTANRVPARVPGRVGYAQDFEGSNSSPDFINVGSDSSLSITGSITLEAWVWIESYPSTWNMVVSRQYGTSFSDGYLLAVNSNNRAYIIVGSASTYRGGISSGSWYHIVGVASGSTRRVYVNGVGGTAGSGTTWTLDANPVLLGAGENGSPGTFPIEQFDGIIDEVRISTTVRSSEWIQAEYNNQNNPNAFVNVGIEE